MTFLRVLPSTDQQLCWGVQVAGAWAVQVDTGCKEFGYNPTVCPDSMLVTLVYADN